MVRPMVHSIKHYVQQSISTVTAGAVTTVDVVVSVARDAVNTVSEVVEGSSIKAVYVEVWARSATTSASSGQMVFFKRMSDGSAPNATQIAALGDWNNKKNIFYTTMGLFNDQDSSAVVMFKGWIKIPKSKQRFGLGDRLQMSFFATGVDYQICGFFTYKEYT